MDHFGFGVDSFDSADALLVTRCRLLQHIVPIVGITAIFGLVRFGTKLPHHLRESHFIGLAHAQVNDLVAGMVGEGGAFCALDFLELINRLRLAVEPAADSFGKEILEV